MKIIGGHDYYDGAGYGVDEAIVFIRKQGEEIWDIPFELPPPTNDSILGSGLSFHYVLVAGKAYPVVREVHDGHYADRRNSRGERVWREPRTAWHYDRASALAALKCLRRRKSVTGRRLTFMPRTEDRIDRFFRETERKEWTAWMIENRIVTGLVSWKRVDAERKGSYLEPNIATLKEVEFYRILDPATIHMEISNFIGGVLPSGPDTVEISDRSRILKAGFDLKSSFRKDAGIKKPRRRKRA